jgi:hypothetical protein
MRGGTIQLVLIVLINVCTQAQAELTIYFDSLKFSPNDSIANFGEQGALRDSETHQTTHLTPSELLQLSFNFGQQCLRSGCLRLVRGRRVLCAAGVGVVRFQKKQHSRDVFGFLISISHHHSQCYDGINGQSICPIDLLCLLSRDRSSFFFFFFFICRRPFSGQ